jgi:hypothetical protein
MTAIQIVEGFPFLKITFIVFRLFWNYLNLSNFAGTSVFLFLFLPFTPCREHRRPLELCMLKIAEFPLLPAV